MLPLVAQSGRRRDGRRLARRLDRAWDADRRRRPSRATSTRALLGPRRPSRSASPTSCAAPADGPGTSSTWATASSRTRRSITSFLVDRFTALRPLRSPRWPAPDLDRGSRRRRPARLRRAPEPRGDSDFLLRLTGRPPPAGDARGGRGAVRRNRRRLTAPRRSPRVSAALQARLVSGWGLSCGSGPAFLYARPSVADCLAAARRDRREWPCRSAPFSLAPHERQVPRRSRCSRRPRRSRCSRAGTAGAALCRRSASASPRRSTAPTPANGPCCSPPTTCRSETVIEGDPYVEQLQHTISQLVPVIMPGDWRFAFQSKGRGGGEWLEPEADDATPRLGGRRLEEAARRAGRLRQRQRRDALRPRHRAARGRSRRWACEYRRCGTRPTTRRAFIEALADVVTDYLAHRPVERALRQPDEPHTHG